MIFAIIGKILLGIIIAFFTWESGLRGMIFGHSASSGKGHPVPSEKQIIVYSVIWYLANIYIVFFVCNQ